MNRVFNYTLDPCGPVYITIGDGGNIEKIDIDQMTLGSAPHRVITTLNLVGSAI